MKGIVINVNRSIIERKSQGNHAPGEHGVRETCTFATLEDGKNVEIPEDLIRKKYNRKNINDNIVDKLKQDLIGKEIEFENDEDGNGVLVRDLDAYIL